MVDLPAHAGQIALAKDLILGTSPWSDTVYLNLLTPYLLGYSVAALLSFLMPVLVAVKLTLSLAYLAFVLTALKVSRHFGASHYLDWMILPVFFGLSFKWGFFPFLVAAPVGLIFILVVEHWVSRPTAYHGWLVILTGSLLLASHLGAFAFFWLTTFVMICVRPHGDGLRRRAAALMPLLVLSALALTGLWIMQLNEQRLGNHLTVDIVFNYHWGRLYELLTNSFDSYLSEPGRGYDWRYIAIASSFLTAPWLIGLKPFGFHRAGAMAPLAVVLAVCALVPTDLGGSWLLWERFVLFLFPSYAWIFSAKLGPSMAPWRVHAGVVALIIGCWFAMGICSVQTMRFDQESASFSKLLAALAPAQRALYFPFDKHRVASEHDYTYIHFASWYEADLHGFVDTNLAYGAQMVVRFRKGRKPRIRWIERDPGSFDWIANQGDQYRYFIIRDGTPKSPSNYFKGALCVPQRVFISREWQVYERTPCDKELKYR